MHQQLQKKAMQQTNRFNRNKPNEYDDDDDEEEDEEEDEDDDGYQTTSVPNNQVNAVNKSNAKTAVTKQPATGKERGVYKNQKL